ncbi:cytochrome P450 4A10-like [Porites lutea]|uniref:cytochrome P450 4A10-like n=1 Tax=Porites lutea TaxID=51062 RepID=UPI003CC5E63F
MFGDLEWLLSSAREPYLLLVSVAAVAVLNLAVFSASVVLKAYSQVRGFDGPQCHWFKGHLDQATFDGRGLQFHLKCTKQYKTAYRVWFGPTKSAVVLCHPDTVKPLLQSTFKEESVCRLLSPFLGVGLGLQNGAKWKSTRKILTPAFHIETIKSYMKVFQQSAEVLLGKWSSSPDGEIELFQDIGLLTLDSILKCAFSYWSDCQVKRPDAFMTAILENTQAIMDRFSNPLYQFDFIYNLTPAGINFKRNSSIVARKADEIIRKRKQNLSEQPEREKIRRQDHFDFLDVLLEAKRDNEHSLTDEEVRAEVRTFMFAGLDTVTSAICWILYCLALHPEHQKKCQEEIDSIFKQNKELQWNDLQNAPYLKLCINEAMRLYSPVPIICRSSDKSYNVQGRTVPKGTFLYVSIFALHRNPHVWENPEVFDPLRFTEERSKGRPSHSFIPFSSGLRNCIGQYFGMAEIKITVAMILQRFNLKVRPDQIVPMEDLLTVLMLRSKTGLRINIHPRKSDVWHDDNDNCTHIELENHC